MPLLKTSNGVVAPPEVAAVILTRIQQGSAVQKLAPKKPLPGNGETVMSLGRGEAGWVGEAQKKPTSNPTVSNKTISAYKMARIITLSKEFADDLPSIYGALVNEGVASLAELFDQTVTGEKVKPGSNFAQLSDADNIVVNDYTSFIAALGAVAQNRARATGILLSLPLYFELAGKVNTLGAPLFTIAGDFTSGTINGLPFATYASTESKGFIGDWNRSQWGTVNGVEIALLDQAAVTIDGELVSLAENNLIGIRLEARFGFQVQDIQDFREISFEATVS